MAKEIKYGAEARKALESGVNQLADTCLLYTSYQFWTETLSISALQQPDRTIYL